MSSALSNFRWAWPRGGHDLLLRAAAAADESAAMAAFNGWLAVNKIEAAGYREQRLLVTISNRLSYLLTDRAERARLVGIERMLWTQSRLGLAAAQDALSLLAANAIEVMVIKGAARSAIDIGDLRGRVANDVDLLVRPRDFRRAHRVLTEGGWSGGNPDDRFITGFGMAKGRLGNVDLHKYPYHQVLIADVDGGDVWTRGERRQFLSESVLVPAPTDRLVMAIAHGGIDGHAHSDWLVDCALLIREGKVDWRLFSRLVEQRRLDAYAAIALGYVAERLEAPAPADVIEAIARRGRRRALRAISALLQSRSKYEISPAVNLARGLFRGARQVERGATLWLLSHRSTVDTDGRA